MERQSGKGGITRRIGVAEDSKANETGCVIRILSPQNLDIVQVNFHPWSLRGDGDFRRLPYRRENAPAVRAKHGFFSGRFPQQPDEAFALISWPVAGSKDDQVTVTSILQAEYKASLTVGRAGDGRQGEIAIDPG